MPFPLRLLSMSSPIPRGEKLKFLEIYNTGVRSGFQNQGFYFSIENIESASIRLYEAYRLASISAPSTAANELREIGNVIIRIHKEYEKGN